MGERDVELRDIEKIGLKVNFDMAKIASVATLFGVLSFAAHVNAQQTPPAATSPAPAATTAAAPAPPPPPPAIKPPPPPPPVHRHITTPILVSGGISLVGLAGGTVFGILAASDHSKYTSQPNNDVALSGEKKAFIADVSFGVAALFGLTAIALYLLPDEPDPTTAAAAKPSGARTWLTAALKGEVLSF